MDVGDDHDADDDVGRGFAIAEKFAGRTRLSDNTLKAKGESFVVFMASICEGV